MLNELLEELTHPDVRALAWAIGSPALFDAAQPVWQGQLRDDAWSKRELARCADWLIELERSPAQLHEAAGDPTVNTPLGHVFEKLILFWQSRRPDVRNATRGLIVRNGGRTLGEFDVVMLRHDGVIETLEVTVKYYLNLKPELGIEGCIGPRAYDRMSEKFAKMTTRQTALGHSEYGLKTICQWLEQSCGEVRTPDELVVENYALARGYIFHANTDAAFAKELSPHHGRGLWQTDEIALPGPYWRNLAGREWLGPYLGQREERGWPNDPAMPRMYANLEARDEAWAETERRFVVRADAGLLKSV